MKATAMNAEEAVPAAGHPVRQRPVKRMLSAVSSPGKHIEGSEHGRVLIRAAGMVVRRVTPPLLGVVLFVVLWAAIASQSPNLPGPAATWKSAVELFSDPFYQNGPNDQGIGWNILHSLQRVGLGFGLAALVGIPLGFLIGRFRWLSDMAAPIMSLLRPVSPLAWLPIGLLVFKAASPAAVWVIFISSIWPMIINTASGVREVPQD
ncbi:MAG: nitrate ABC transporter permease, partial [Gammaproteobacteria bacterium]